MRSDKVLETRFSIIFRPQLSIACHVSSAWLHPTTVATRSYSRNWPPPPRNGLAAADCAISVNDRCRTLLLQPSLRINNHPKSTFGFDAPLGSHVSHLCQAIEEESPNEFCFCMCLFAAFHGCNDSYFFVRIYKCSYRYLGPSFDDIY